MSGRDVVARLLTSGSLTGSHSQTYLLSSLDNKKGLSDQALICERWNYDFLDSDCYWLLYVNGLS